jgi:hypothetical protein
MNTNKSVMCPEELAARWNVSVGALANRRSNGQGPAWLKPMGRVLYRVSDIETWEAEHVVKPIGTAA